MMEQNSDRIYWIIGAVLVGSILIGLAAAILPKLFHKQITKLFDGLFNKASNANNGITDKG